MNEYAAVLFGQASGPPKLAPGHVPQIDIHSTPLKERKRYGDLYLVAKCSCGESRGEYRGKDREEKLVAAVDVKLAYEWHLLEIKN